MPDLRHALRAAAPVPGRELDMAAIRRRARSRRVRLAAWAAGLGLAVVAGVPGATSLLVATNDGPSRPSDARAVTEEKTGPAGPSSGPSTSTSAATDPAASSTGVPGGSPVGTAWQPGTTTSLAPDSASSSAYPRRAGCWVDTRELAPGSTRTCRFTATDEGGAYLSTNAPVWSTEAPAARGEVVITRDGQRYVAWRSGDDGVSVSAGDATVFAGCCGDRFILPGDLVEVRLTHLRDDGFVVTLAAGADESG